jgi:hypothetical protein
MLPCWAAGGALGWLAYPPGAAGPVVQRHDRREAWLPPVGREAWRAAGQQGVQGGRERIDVGQDRRFLTRNVSGEE